LQAPLVANLVRINYVGVRTSSDQQIAAIFKSQTFHGFVRWQAPLVGNFGRIN